MYKARLPKPRMLALAPALAAAVALFTFSGVPASAETRDTGRYLIHYNALPTDVLDAKVAGSYGIKRSRERGLLNVAVREKVEGEPAGRAAAANVSAQWTNLSGQMGTIPIRQIREQGAIYYIGEFAIRDQEMLTFTLQVNPDGTPPQTISFRKQFIVD